MGNIWVDYDSMDIIEERYELASERVREIEEKPEVPEQFQDYFRRTASFLVMMTRVRRKLETGYYEDHPMRWPAENRAMYEDILPEYYAESYGNPAYAVRMLGDGFGPLLCFLYAQERGLIAYIFEGRTEEAVCHMEIFIQICGMFEQDPDVTPDRVKDALYWFESDYTDVFVRNRIRAQIDPAYDFAVRILMDSDLSDTSFLYRYGEYITEDEVRTAQFLNTLPADEISKMADAFSRGYHDGFVLGGKPIGKKSTVSLIYHVGFERVLRQAVRNLMKMGLRPTISRYGVSAVTGTSRHQGISGAVPNPQYDYDHREDDALFLDRRFAERKLEVIESSYGEFSELAHRYGGPAVLETFGEDPFSPESCPEALRYSEEQEKIAVKLRSDAARITYEYIYGQERSFTIMSFPSPKIDEKRYEEIFRETMKVNTLDTDLYGRIQSTMIDALDRGTHVRILGKGDNKTDLTVRLYPLDDPAKETIFENCLADVNIPAGEVFTTPVLKGTEGLLHVSEVYLSGLRFTDLKLRFEDGCVTDYSCANFEDEAENRKYIEDNILFHHKTLPMGEFAIGTNTTAYAMIKKYGIAPRMDILIAEKTGPHFAVGDTCYSWDEDNETFNPDGKKIVARENDFSRLRREDISKAYFNCHTDITIPYEELGLIEVLGEDGYHADIIRDGRFVLPGTGALNAPLDEAGVVRG